MNKTYMERCIRAAGIAIDTNKDKVLKKNKKGMYCVTSQMLGKAAGFGPTVQQKGILPAVASYSDTSKANENAIIDCIFEILKILEEVVPNDHNLGEYLEQKRGYDLRRARDHIVSASVALKVMLRTYEEWKDDANNQGSEEA